MMIEEKYTEEQMKLRQEVLQILFKKFGNGSYSNQSIYLVYIKNIDWNKYGLYLYGC